ncbi:MAG: LysR family transcriptional regulator [Alphaproteobacteria bacterium]|nr:LysR family transcriptional regulator [Alphaproteobacteria bacterium]MBU2418212.1 LysR family transcriptional regulator [Alphaproteobacteria bacterium]
MSQDFSWDLYRTFGAVLREGSLSGAARQLGITQPSVARHIDALEAGLGVALFVRSARGLSPTDAALELKPHADLLASTSAAFLRTAEGRTGEVRGTVRISASEIVGTVHLPPILTGLRLKHPDLAIELVLSNSADDLLQREADIAIRMFRPTQAALVAKPVGAFEIGLHAHPDYLARRGTPATMEDLRDHDVIGYDVETPALRAFLQPFPMLQRPAFALRVDSDVAQLAAIRAGFGIGVCQTSIAAMEPKLTRVLPKAFAADLETWIVMHEDMRTNTRCRVVFDELVERLPTRPR